jgi:serine/threonine protein kinase
MSNSITHALQRSPLFQSLSQETRNDLAKQVSLSCFSKGTPIIRHGEAGDCMFLIASGHVRVVLPEAHSPEHAVVTLGDGQVFGEMALLTGAPRSADVEAIEDTECIVFPRKAMEELMRHNPELARMLTTILGERLIRSGRLPQVGKYRLLDELARGGMAVVYEGFHPDLERPVAIKMLHHELVYQAEYRKRFRNEARIIALLHHPNIVEVFDTEEAYATFFIIMEKLKGNDLKEAIERRGNIPHEETRHILQQLTSAVCYAHSKGVIHRDIKPSNVMLSPDGQVKLMDFGIALKPRGNRKATKAPQYAGTPFYMAPEQQRGQRIDGRVDLYALGIMAYEMLTGSLPFSGTPTDIYEQKSSLGALSPQSIDPTIPDDLETFVKRATAFHIDDRFVDGKDMLQLLQRSDSSAIFLDDLCTSHLTLVFPHEQRDAVASLVKQWKRELKEIPDIIVS